MPAEWRQTGCGRRRLVLQSGQERLSRGGKSPGTGGDTCWAAVEHPAHRCSPLWFWNSLSSPELGCYKFQQGWWAGRVGISCPQSWSPRAQSPLCMQLSPLGRTEQYQLHPGIPAAASHTHGCEPVVWYSASDWETTASHPSSNGRRYEWITVEHQPIYQPQWLAEGWAPDSSSSQRFIFVGLIWFVTTFKKEPLLACVLNVISSNPW